MIRLTENDKCEVEIITDHAVERFLERSGNDISVETENSRNNLLKELETKTRKLERVGISEENKLKHQARIRVINQQLNGLDQNKMRKARTMIEFSLKHTKRIVPKNYTLKLLNNDFQDAKYYSNDGFVFVVSDKVLKTIMIL